MKPSVEHRIMLDKCELREYQKEIWYALDTLGFKKLISIWPRRAGKDFTIWNYCIRKAIEKPIIVFYCAPTFQQVRRIIWDGMTIDGRTLLSFIPDELIKSKNSQTMAIRLYNNSIIQCVGFNNFQESIVGTNPSIIVFSEFSKAVNGDALAYASPIIAANPDAKVIIATTPMGKNHLYHLYELAQELDDWYVIKRTVDDIKHIPADVLAQERARIGEDLYEQEYNCSFDRGAIQGTYFYKNLQDLRAAQQVCTVPHERGMLVHTAWDLGVRDACVILFFQVTKNNSVIRIIDCYSNNNLGIDHYINVLKQKREEYGYNYGNHFAPHDLRVREASDGISRYHKALELGVDFIVLPQSRVMEGIDNIWANFNKFWIDDIKCERLLNALENYYREWDEVHQVYKKSPVHNFASHWCDALRALCQSLTHTQQSDTKEDLERARIRAMYGGNNPLHPQLRFDPRYDR